MLSGLFLTPGFGDKPVNVLHLGTGAGIMPMFLKEQLGEKLNKITTIDNNAQMLTVAERYFGFQAGEKLESVCADAYDYVASSSDKGAFDMIIMDINYSEEDLNISPPWKFLETEFLQKVVDLANDNALIALNVLYYSKDAKARVFENIKAIQGVSKKALVEVEDCNNRIFMLSTSKGASNISLSDVAENIESLEVQVKNLEVSKALWMKDLQLGEHVKSFAEVK
jgi:spermidine synthase